MMQNLAEDYSFIDSQIQALALARTALQEAEKERATAVNARLEDLEEKIQLIIQQNQTFEADLNQARTLYKEKLISNASGKKTIQDEIASLENQVKQLNINLTEIRQSTLSLNQEIEANERERARRAHFWRNAYGCQIM